MKEFPIYSILRKILPKIKNPIIFELGLSTGEDTAKILNICGKSVKYFGFEPDPRCIAHLKSLELYRKITLVEAAIGKEEGETVLYQFSSRKDESDLPSTGPTSIYKPRLHDKLRPHLKYKAGCKVKVISLDNFCNHNDISYIDFIWSDIQSGEYNMILGGQKILNNVRYLYMEHMKEKMYHGQRGLKDMLDVLPGKWNIMLKTPTDVLVRNLNFGR